MMDKGKDKEGIKAVGDYIIIKPLPEEERASGIIVTDDPKNRSQKGVVVSAGEKCDPNIKSGQIIYFKRHGVWELGNPGDTEEKLLRIESKFALAIE